MRGSLRVSRAGWRARTRRSNGRWTRRWNACPLEPCRTGLAGIVSPGYADLPAEVSLRLLGRAIAQVGNEGPVELGKLEALHAALAAALAEGRSARFRRTLAGAVVTLSARHAHGRAGAGAPDSVKKRAIPAAKVRSPSPGRMTHIRPIPLAEGACRTYLVPGGTRTLPRFTEMPPTDRRTPRARPGRLRTWDEREPAQFRPLGDHCPVAARPVHPVPEPGPAHAPRQDISFSQLLNDVDAGPRARRHHPGAGNPRHLYGRPRLQHLCAERQHAGAAPLRQGRADHRASAGRERAVVRVAARLVAARSSR